MRGVQGLGAALMLPAALSIVMNMFAEGAERNKALGIWGGIGAGAATVGLLAGGVLTRYAGWEYIFFLNVPIGAAVMAFARRVVPESRLSTSRRRYDPLGARLRHRRPRVFGLCHLAGPASGVGRRPDRSPAGGVGCDALALMVVEARSDAPLLPLHLFRSGTIAGANVVGFLLGASFFSFIFVGTLYMQQVLGYSALKTGVAWLAASLTSVALAGLSQMLVTKTSAKVVMAAGMALIGIGVVWASQVPVHAHFWANLAGPFFVAGAGTAFAFIPVSIAALAGVGEGDAGVASGLLNTSQQLGGAIGVAVASTVAASRAHSLAHLGYGPAAALTGGFSAALWVCGLVGLAAVPIAFALVRRQELARAVAHSMGREPR